FPNKMLSQSSNKGRYHLAIFSSKSKSSLVMNVQSISTYQTAANFRDVAIRFSVSDHYKYKSIFIANSMDSLKKQISVWNCNQNVMDIQSSKKAFLFTGQGSE